MEGRFCSIPLTRIGWPAKVMIQSAICRAWFAVVGDEEGKPPRHPPANQPQGVDGGLLVQALERLVQQVNGVLTALLAVGKGAGNRYPALHPAGKLLRQRILPTG